MPNKRKGSATVTTVIPGRGVPEFGRIQTASVKIYLDTSCYTKAEMLGEIFKEIFLGEGIKNPEFDAEVLTEIEKLKNKYRAR